MLSGKSKQKVVNKQGKFEATSIMKSGFFLVSLVPFLAVVSELALAQSAPPEECGRGCLKAGDFTSHYNHDVGGTVYKCQERRFCIEVCHSLPICSGTSYLKKKRFPP